MTTTHSARTAYQRKLHNKCLELLDGIDKADANMQMWLDFLNKFLAAKWHDNIRLFNTESGIRAKIEKYYRIKERLENYYFNLKKELI